MSPTHRLRAYLRVKDVDFARNQLVVRSGKGDKDRVTMLPAVVKTALTRHLEAVKQQHEMDLRHGAGTTFTSPCSSGPCGRLS